MRDDPSPPDKPEEEPVSNLIEQEVRESAAQPDTFTPMNRRAVAEGFAWTAGFALLTKTVFPLATIYISRTLGPEQMGVVALLTTILMVSEIFRDAGITQTYLADQRLDRQREGTYVVLASGMGVLAALVLISLKGFLATWLHLEQLLWAIPLITIPIICNGIATIPRGKLLRSGGLKLSGLIDTVCGSMGLVLAVTLVHLGFGFLAIVIQLVFQSTAGLIGTLIYSPKTSIALQKGAALDTLSRAWALLVANAINNLFLLSDTFVIARLLSPTAVGLYNTAKNISYKPAEFITFPLQKTLTVAFSLAASDPARLGRSYCRSIIATVLFVTPIYIGLALFAEPVVLLLLGDPFAGSVPVLSIMCIYLAARTLGTVSGTALVASGRPSVTMWPWFPCVGIVALGIWLNSTDASITKIAWSFTVGALFVYSTLVAIAFRYFPAPQTERKRLLQAVMVTGATGAVLGGLNLIPLDSAIRLGLGLVLGPTFHLGLLGLLNERRVGAYMSKSGVKALYRTL